MIERYVRYRDDLEKPAADEPETFAKIVEAMSKGEALTREMYGHSVRTSHAKPHGLLLGQLQVLDTLPAHLRQGLFADPHMYAVLVRLSHLPGDLNDDRKVSAPRGMAIKVLNVQGEKLPEHAGQTTQDFVLNTGKVLNATDAKSFLVQIGPIEAMAPKTPQSIKAAVSGMSRAMNAALGGKSSALDFFGHPVLHPLTESYYSQAPVRYGEYVAKVRVAPASAELEALGRTPFEPQNENGLRAAVVEFFREHAAHYDVAVQLCTDLERMPIENANAEWPEDLSPFQSVARLILPAQDAFSAENQSFIEDELSFSPAHSLSAHRPLGSIMRARMYVYEAMAKLRREANGRALIEPSSITGSISSNVPNPAAYKAE